MLSRRHFMMRAAGATAVVVGAPWWLPGVAMAAGNTDPRPIPGGIPLLGIVTGTSDPTIFHVFPPAFQQEVSTITDFIGLVGAAHVQGMGTGTGNKRLSFDVDMRCMDGAYVDMSGQLRRGTFGFI